jgi:carboxyl-terminal processing protease
VIKLLIRTIVLPATFAALPATTTSAVFAQGATEQDPGQLVDEAWQVINRDFVDPTYHHHDWPRTRREILSKKYGGAKEAYAAIAGMLKELDDPQARLMSQAELASTIQQLTGELADTSLADPWVIQDEKTAVLQLVHLIADSPASKGRPAAP